MRKNSTARQASLTLGDLIVAVDDQAARRSKGKRDRRRLAALWVAVTLLGSNNRGVLRRLATAG